jgi:VWFA-related protein
MKRMVSYRTSRLVAALLVTALLLLPSRLVAAAEAVAVINQVGVEQFPDVAAYLTVVDSAGLPIADLSRDRVQLVHNGNPVPDFSLELVDATQDGLAIVVAVDTSGSMQGQPLAFARDAVRIFLERMGPRDRGALLSFGQTVQVVQDLTDDRDALQRATDALTARGDTALYDGAFQAITMAAQNPLGRRAVIVISDGEDTHSGHSLDDVIAKARETNTPVSVIGFGEFMAEPMQRLTAATGGLLSIAPDADRLGERAGQTAELLRKQYVVRYRAPDSRPPENELEIVVQQGDAQIRTAQRFPAPPMPPLAVSLADLVPGGTVRGSVELRPGLTNATRVDAVEYVLDGAPLQTVTEPPYAFAWDTASVPPGQHTLTVRARLAEQTAQQELVLTVAPSVEVRINVPGGLDVAGSVKLTAEVAAGAPVQSVAWAIDDRPIGSAQQSPFEIEWNSASVPPGDHTVTAEARDEAGNVGRASQAVRVTASSSAASPVAGSPVAGGAPGTGLNVTPTISPTRTPTATPAPADNDGPGGISWAYWIGGGVLLALAVGALVASTRRRAAATVVSASSVPGDPYALGQPGQRPPTMPQGNAPPMVGDRREAETGMFNTLPASRGGMGGPSGALGRSSVIVFVAGLPPHPYPLGVDQFVGRAPGPGIIVINDDLVSRRHARISWEDGHFLYRDLGPLNPTRRDGRTLPNPYMLRDGDRLRVGHSELVFRA